MIDSESINSCFKDFFLIGIGGGGKIDFEQGSHLDQMLKYAYEIVYKVL